jgi:hypothetical protein
MSIGLICASRASWAANYNSNHSNIDRPHSEISTYEKRRLRSIVLSDHVRIDMPQHLCHLFRPLADTQLAHSNRVPKLLAVGLLPPGSSPVIHRRQLNHLLPPRALRGAIPIRRDHRAGSRRIRCSPKPHLAAPSARSFLRGIFSGSRHYLLRGKTGASGASPYDSTFADTALTRGRTSCDPTHGSGVSI